MKLNHKLAALAVGASLVLGLGTAQAYTLEERVLGCIETQEVLDLVFEAYAAGTEKALTQALFVEEVDILPAQRYVVATVIEALYLIPKEVQLPSLEQFQTATFSSCIQIIGTGFIDPPEADTGEVIKKPTRRDV